jgi:uncharacterized membrane protein
MLGPQQTHVQRLAMTLAGAGLGLTFIAELVTLRGDVGRMNVVFKFYLLAWFFFSVAAAAILVWLWPRIWAWRSRILWIGSLALLILAALTYPIIGSAAKADDRWPDVVHPPRTLDGMAFMLGESSAGQSPSAEPGTVIYMENDVPLRLGLDHAAIRWMQENLPGTPTIVEGHTGEYRWGARFANYTGLPTIVGWNWHLRQHNAVLPGSVVEQRIEELNYFYNTNEVNEARTFLERYQAGYVIVGDLERALYSTEGLDKFERMVTDGALRIVYPENGLPGEVTIYKVIRPDAETAQVTGMLHDG